MWSYVIDKGRLSIRLIAAYSEERRKAACEYAKAHGIHREDRQEQLVKTQDIR